MQTSRWPAVITYMKTFYYFYSSCVIHCILYIGYRKLVLQTLQQVSTLDGGDRLGKPTLSGDESPMDIPGLEDFLEFLISTDSSASVEPVYSFFF